MMARIALLILALIAPVVWGIEMLRAERIADGRLKLGFYPLSILALVGVISALPVMAGWPLRHGYGGLLGDGVYHLVLKLFAMLNEERAPLAAGVVLLAAAVQTSGNAIGFEAEAVMKALLRSLGSGMRYATSKRRWEEAAAIAPTFAASAVRVRQSWFPRMLRSTRTRTNRRRRSISIPSVLRDRTAGMKSRPPTCRRPLLRAITGISRRRNSIRQVLTSRTSR